MPEPEKVYLKTVELASGCELLGNSRTLNAKGGNTIELRDGYVLAFSAKTKRRIGVTFANIKSMEFQPTEANPFQGKNRRAAEARESAAAKAATCANE